MKIYGGKDYYDNAGQTDVLFVRKDQVFDVHPFEDEHFAVGAGEVYLFYVAVGGFTYPAAYFNYPEVVTNKPPYRIPAISAYIFDEGDLFNAIAGKTDYNKISWYDKKSKADRIIEHFARDTNRHSDWLISNKIVVGYSSAKYTPRKQTSFGEIYPESYSVTHSRDKNQLIANAPFMKQLECYKFIPPGVAYSLIYSYIDGILPSSKPIVTLANDERLEKAGFDKKISFRHRK